MNELNQLIQNVSLTCLFFGGAVALCIGLDAWAQRLSHRRIGQTHLALRKRI